MDREDIEIGMAVRVGGWGAGVAFRVLGWETEADEDTEWSGYENETGRVLVCMVGDDQKFAIEPDELEPLDRASYCGDCGQIGCGHNPGDE